MIATRPGAATPMRMYPSTTATVDGDLDLIAIEHAMNGEPTELTPAERVETARQLDVRGVCTADIARLVGTTRATVTAWRQSGWQAPKPVIDHEPLDLGTAQHGRSGYSKGCRCRTCRDGASAYKRAAKARQRAAA